MSEKKDDDMVPNPTQFRPGLPVDDPDTLIEGHEDIHGPGEDHGMPEQVGINRERAEGRLSREQETRQAQEYDQQAASEDWEEKGNLDTTQIPPRPGMVQWWVRTRVGTDDDVQNLARMMNQGWRPRPAETIPKGVYFNTVRMRDFGDVIGFRGQVLMERPKELHEKQARYYRQQARNMKRSIDEHMMQVHEPGKGMGAPTVHRQSRTVVGNGRRPRAVD